MPGQGRCKECHKQKIKENREEKSAYYKAYDKKRDQNPDRILMKKEYIQGKGRDVSNNCKNRYSDKNPKKRQVHSKVSNAVRSGLLVKGTCEVCGDIKVYAHHCDYDKPLDIIWLCAKHHRQWHEENGEGLNGHYQESEP